MSDRRTGRSVLLAATAAALLVLGVVLAAPAPAVPGHPRTATDHSAAKRAKHNTPLEHVVVVSQQGHTFDNYLGTRSGADGLPTGVCLPGAGSSSPCVAPHPISGSPHAALPATAASQRASVAGGRMDGFVRAQAVHGASGRIAMGYYPAHHLPVLNGLADRGVVFDRWFAAVPGGSIANDFFAAAATSTGDVSAVPSGGWGDTPLIFDRLRAGGVSWKVYVENYDPHATIRTATSPQQRAEGQVARVPLLSETRWLGPQLRGHVVPLSRYYQDLAKGTLPQVAFVTTTQHTERPPQSPVTGQAQVRDVTNALLGSSARRDSVLFLTYADSGGWYDHVPPVAAPDGKPRGLRVPTVAISPYLRPGTVDHQVLDSAAILKLIEQNWGLRPLTGRDAGAPNLLGLFTFHSAPHTPSLVAVTPASSMPHQPERAVLYLGYLLVVLLGALGISATLWWTRGSLRTEDGTS